MSNCTVLIVEDEPEWRELHKSQLEKAGLSCYATNNGIDAIDYAQRNNIKVVIIDEILLVTPGQDGELQRLQGRGVIREIINRGLDTKFIFITASPYNKGNLNEPGFWREFVSLKILPGVIEVINKQEIDHNCEETYERIINIVKKLNQETHKINQINWRKTPFALFFQLVRNLRVDASIILFNFNIHLDGRKDMDTINIDLSKSKGIVNLRTQVNAEQTGVETNYFTNPNVVETAQEMEAVLDDVWSKHPIKTATQQRLFAVEFEKAVEKKPALKAKIISAVKSGGVEALKQACSHPAVDIALAAYDGWKNP
ncbi:response regulator [Nostoc sp. MS1]|uniref:response regulator n=1 Tax=Nostoc sp. MS1 TaxID=2764711 RepID=UPI001CC8200E|nr:response regulator [Nostoc sp. MS1]BCL35031.1 hypothetical protein NSMS1_14780 [Nostoc sp. MS1]